jgi:hypothetical protein
VDSIIHTKFGGFAFVLAVTFSAAAILYFGGKWFVLRFSDPKWLKKYVPLFGFLFITLRIFQLVQRLISRWVRDDRVDGILVVGYMIFIAACIGAWRRYLFTHPDGPPDTPATPPRNELTLLNLNPSEREAAPKAPHPLG